jgi:flagellar FliL protein
MSEEKDARKETPPPAPGGKSSKLLPIFVGLNSLLLVGVMGVLVMQMRKQAHPPEHSEESAEKHDEGDSRDESAPEKKDEKKPEPKEEKAEAKDEKKDEKKDGAAKGSAGGLGPLVKLSDFVIHLRNPEIDRYARMSFEVEVFADPDKDSLNAHMPRVRDAFISYLSDRTLEELQGAEGLGRTKDALQTKLRDLVPEARVRSLYISDFVVQ